jgi:hypothetical protein
MSADVTSQEDLDDIAFRALLEPLALQVLPGRSSSPAVAPPDPAALEATAEEAAEQSPGDRVPQVIANLAAPEPAAPAILSEGRPPFDAWHDQAAKTIEVTPDGDPPSPAAIEPSVSLDAWEMLPEDWSAPAGVSVAPAEWGLEMLPEDWQALPAVPSGLPARLAPEAKPEDRSPSTGHFTALAPGILPEGRWRLTVALPDPAARLQPLPASVPPAVVPPAGMPPAIVPPRGIPSFARSGFSAAAPQPHRPPTIGVAEGAVRPPAGPRLVARAGTAGEAARLPGSATQLVMRRAALPPARVRWSVVLLAGIASAVTVASMSWLFAPPPQSQATPEPALTAPPRPIQAVTPVPAVPPVAAYVAAPARTQSASPPQALIGLLTQRGDAALAVGDIIAARLLYERAATMGSATAATAAGKTYDLDFLLRADTHGIRPDPAAAATWYRKAAALGDPEGRTLLGHLSIQSRP